MIAGSERRFLRNVGATRRILHKAARRRAGLDGTSRRDDADKRFDNRKDGVDHENQSQKPEQKSHSFSCLCRFLFDSSLEAVNARIL